MFSRRKSKVVENLGKYRIVKRITYGQFAVYVGQRKGWLFWEDCTGEHMDREIIDSLLQSRLDVDIAKRLEWEEF